MESVSKFGKCFVEEPKKKPRGYTFDLHNFQLCFLEASLSLKFISIIKW